MMIHAYNKLYLDDAMASLGAMFDYAVNVCGEDIELFYARFISSGVARNFAMANPKYIAGMSGIELAMLVAARTGDKIPDRGPYIDMGSPEYWTGWTLAYLSWYLNMDFRTLQSRGVGVMDLYARYTALHEADLSKSVNFAIKRIKGSSAEGSLLKRARKNSSLTQKELAALSGNSLRVIRSYEQGQRSLENAGAESVRDICRALGCRLEDLVTGYRQ